jgi:hypothetical protein
VIVVKVGGVVLQLDPRLTQEDERLGDGEAVRCPPFFIDTVEGLLGLLSGCIVHEVVLGGFREVEVTAFCNSFGCPWFGARFPLVDPC